MILYIDTAALVPLLIEEATSDACGELWDNADTVVGTRLAYIEASAALAQAQRMERLTAEQSRDAVAVLDALWPVVEVIELDYELMCSAAGLAVTRGLRGYDATHCAAAVAANSPDLVAASGDGRLLGAWQAEGVAVRNLNV